MTYYIRSNSVDPYANLALEQHVFDNLDRAHRYFMLWQNHNSIIVGRYQNTQGEINGAFVKERGITVARRLSGGGAVYHDLGNLNFTFVSDAENGHIDFASFCGPVRDALASLGVRVEISGRNDMTVEGKKFSGNAQYRKQGRVMHHGTILFDSDLEIVSKALNVAPDKIESKGIKSVQSRVTNIRPYLKRDVSLEEFWEALRGYMFSAYDMRDYTLTETDRACAAKLREDVYRRWSWNYGASPPYTVRKKRRVPGAGSVEALLDVGPQGIIKNAAFYGDFFGNSDPAELGLLLRGRRFEEGELRAALGDTDVSRYFSGIDAGVFLSLLLE